MADKGTEKKKDNGEDTEHQQQFMAAIGALTEGVNNLTGRLDRLEREQKETSRRRSEETAAEKRRADAEKQNAGDTDLLDRLNTLSNAELVQTVLGLVEERISGPILERMEQGSADSERERVKARIQEASKAHDDFWYYKDEMANIARQTPGIDAEDAYFLAKSKHPQKGPAVEEALAKQRQEKQAQEEKQKAAEEKSKHEGEPKLSFGGLTPTSGKQEEASRMAPEEAAAKAYDEVMAGIDVGEATE